jgi:sterol desaturase/sphingolipid hydroxylase (fatty acid hydroxylase superfamily)
MEFTRQQLLLLFSLPTYAIVIGVEMLLSKLHHRNLYSVKGVFYNLYLTALNMALDIVFLGFSLGVLSWFYQYRFFQIDTIWLYWLVLVVFEDFLYYLLHFVDHHVRLFWAVHVSHHSSEEFNLTVGFRSSVFQPLYRFIYFIPLALCGFKALDIAFIYSLTQIYGILIHTQLINKLGFLEWFLATPSHHRVHHGKNPIYLDKNMGMVLIIWDKLFGTFQKEEDYEKVQFGLTTPINPETPVTVVFHEWKQMLHDLKISKSLKEKWLYIFGKPGWSHDGSRKTSKELAHHYRSSRKSQLEF